MKTNKKDYLNLILSYTVALMLGLPILATIIIFYLTV